MNSIQQRILKKREKILAKIRYLKQLSKKPVNNFIKYFILGLLRLF